MARPLGGKNMKHDAPRLPFLLNTIVTSPSSPPSSSSSPALHVSTTTHHWGQATLRQWFIPPSTRLDQLVLQLLRVYDITKAFQPGELRSSPKKAPCLTAAKSKGSPQPSWIWEQGHQITIPSACSSPSIACSPSCLAFTRRGVGSRCHGTARGIE